MRHTSTKYPVFHTPKRYIDYLGVAVPGQHSRVSLVVGLDIWPRYHEKLKQQHLGVFFYFGTLSGDQEQGTRAECIGLGICMMNQLHLVLPKTIRMGDEDG
jgi:hypothetical protein